MEARCHHWIPLCLFSVRISMPQTQCSEYSFQCLERFSEPNDNIKRVKCNSSRDCKNEMNDIFFTLLLIFRIFTSEAYLNEHLAVIHPKYISDSIASGTKTTLMSYKLPPEEVYQGADCIQGSKYLPSLLFLHFLPHCQLTTLRLGKFFFLIFLNKVTNLRL